jgi:hypothetical protein
MSHYPDCGCVQCRVRAVKQPINIPVVPADAVLPMRDPCGGNWGALGVGCVCAMPKDFVVKDSGERQHFESGMQRDTQEGKIQYTRLLDGPMLKRWADHITKGAVKYPDIAPGVANWTQANSVEEMQRFKESAFRHFMEWALNENPTEDVAAGIFFNVNGYETVKEKLRANKS